MMAEIVRVELGKTKAGNRCVRVILKTTDNVWIGDFIGESAPSFVSAKFWTLLGLSRGWASFASDEAFDLIGLKVDIDTEDSDYGPKVTDIRMAGAEPATIEPPDDDIPF